LQIAKQNAADFAMARKVAQGRLSDAQSSFEEMAGALKQPVNQVLKESEEKRRDANHALECLEGTSSADVAVAEKGFLEAQADVARLGEEQTTARKEAEAAT